ncbi:MAG: type 1 periplasmic binding fold superfamily protein [Saprospiraceae bacterium]
MSTRFLPFLTVFLLLVLAAGCDDDDMPEVPNEEELITTMRYTLTPVAGGAAVTFTFTDLDGDGGNAPVISAPALAANTAYTGEIMLLNETETPAENVTEEIRDEKEEHQFFYVAASGLNVAIATLDLDADNNPVGLESTLVTGAASSGNLTITLRHEPMKPNNGTLAGAGGETDIEVTFNVQVQ